MMTDKELRFSDAQALTDGAISANIVRVGKGDVGVGNNITLAVSVNGATGAMTVTLQTADDAAMASPIDVAVFNATADAVAAGGKVIDARLPMGCKTYLRLKYGGATGGSVSAGLVKDA